MSAQMEYYEEQEEQQPARAEVVDALPRGDASIVPADSISVRALLAVVAIMTFLASLTLGAVVLVRAAAGEWQEAVAREITIQVRATDQVEADVRNAVALASSTAGISSARAFSKEESASLLEPWLGRGLAIDELPVPRMIVIRTTPGETPDLEGLRKQLATQVPNATFDDHRGWIDRMRSVARRAVLLGLAVLGLVLAATMLSVMFATRGAMSTNRQIIEVLHVVGAKEGFIAGEFQRHFLLLGLKGAAVGGGAAMLLFALSGFWANWFRGPEGQSMLFGNLQIGTEGYGAMVGLIILVAVVTAGTSRLTVHRTLKAMEQV